VTITHSYFATLFLVILAGGGQPGAQGQPMEQKASAVAGALRTEGVVVQAGVPLHVRVTHTAHLHTGAAVVGILTEPIFVRDRLVLPVGSTLRGTVTAYAPVDRIMREQALLNGDVTPLHDPVVEFTSVHLVDANVDVALDTRALIRATTLVRFSNAKKRSLIAQAIAGVKSRVHDTYESIAGSGKKDRGLQLFYGQLPYHPQRIWAGTQLIADLNAPATVMLPSQAPVAESEAASLNGITVDARLATSLDSKTAKKGDVVTALVTAPVFDAEHKLILPEGTEIDGLVSASQPARSFGRNGQLRFAIRGVKDLRPLPGGPKETVYGTLTGAEGSAGQNLSVDSEGNVKANPDKHRFVAPLLLAATALAGHDEDHGGGGAAGGGIGRTTVASNGFGLIARVIALTLSNQNVALGFGAYAFAKSIYFRFLIRGHEVTFPKDTQVEVTLSTR
jgi:hypothetical protein